MVFTSSSVPSRIGRFTVERKLGEGGMGVVYAARDDRLERTVALKMLSGAAADDAARDRLWREARAAASVNHPNICQIYDVGEEQGQLFITMELLEGEPLDVRLQRGALSAADAVATALGMLAALAALHARGMVHRDLKPSNVFLTSHGVKLLDFGLAQPLLTTPLATAGDATHTGIVMGTPRYMAPEQVAGEPLDARTDVFAAGAILFEMLAGRPAFTGATLADIVHATRYEQPPALGGSSAVAALDRVIRRALAKRRAERHPSADDMAADLRAVQGTDRATTAVLAHALTRLVVLPFRILRPDGETDFLAFSLADAIATSLSGRPSLVVRSTAMASRFDSERPDLKALATDADVDRVVMGTILRAADRLRVTTQLVDAPSGTLMASHTVQSSMGDLFHLQDDIARRMSQALALPLGSDVPAVTEAPHDARAYELFLRGNEASRSYDGLVRARELYERCVALDPGFAPAWAQLGRCHRVIGKYVVVEPESERRAEEALQRALAISPRLTLAHKYYAQLEADTGGSEAAVVRLVGEAARHGTDAELFAGLVHACRYCGLNDEALAAHAEARRLDPNVATSVDQTLHMAGKLDALLAIAPPALIAGADDGIRVIALGLCGQRDEARARLEAMRTRSHIPAFARWVHYLDAWLDRRPADMHVHMASLGSLKIVDDPEAIFQEGWMLCDVGEYEHGFELLRHAVARGYYPVAVLTSRPQFDPLRREPAFRTLLTDASKGRLRALTAFRAAGGERLLGAQLRS